MDKATKQAYKRAFVYGASGITSQEMSLIEAHLAIQAFEQATCPPQQT